MIVRIRLLGNKRIYISEPVSLDLEVNNYVMAKIQDELKMAKVAFIDTSQEHRSDENRRELACTIERKATQEDIDTYCGNKEDEALQECLTTVEQSNIGMKIIGVRYMMDNEAYIVYFHAEEKVNFRNLVGKLNRKLKARVELRQVGPRDEAKLIGGIGKCGLPLCCQTFLREFNPVSIKMAKQQGLSLNPDKISGVCGRLLCCLVYENKEYGEVRSKMPKVRQQVTTPFGVGTVTELNLLKETVMVKLKESEVIHELAPDQLAW
jgi:cell fate regulator YaaT (PSP1 superfamily)